MRFVLFSLLSLAIAFSAKGQAGPDVIINEYFNESDQNDEWTEILVVKDNLDLTGWFIGDNNGDTDVWRPKLRFKDKDVWRNLRRGTYIVLQHAAVRNDCALTLEDTLKNDGYIRVCVRNAAYFEGGDATTMFLNSAGDFLHLVDPSGRHVFGLGHDPDPGNSVRNNLSCLTASSGWTDINATRSGTRPCGPFVFLEEEVPNGQSFGHKENTLAVFNSNPGIFITQTTDPRFGLISPTLGRGNNTANSDLIVSLRQPDWVRETGCLTPQNSGNRLDWTAVTDPNPSDTSIGYLVLRSTVEDMAMPAQGREYRTGDRILTGPVPTEVMAVIRPSTRTSFVDVAPIVNGSYRVVAFRYSGPPPIFSQDRGPAYNLTQYYTFRTTAQPQYIVEAPDVVCNGDTTTIVLQNPPVEPVHWAFDTVAGADVTVIQNGVSAIFVVNDQGANRDSVIATMQIQEAGLCATTSNLRAAIRVQYRPGVEVTPVADSVLRNEQARFKVTVTGSNLTVTSNPALTITLPQATVGFTFLGGDTTLRVSAFPTDLPRCLATDSATVFELTPLEPVFYNNLVMEKGKADNQFLTIKGGTVQSIEIYNRWGKRVLKQGSYANNWRGEPGNYTFKATLVRGGGLGSVSLKGWIEVQ